MSDTPLVTAGQIAEVLDGHWDIDGTHAEGFECSCGYGLGNGTGDLDGRHRRHVAEMVAQLTRPETRARVEETP